jgi:nucleotide-binding universal stress UspA family protein
VKTVIVPIDFSEESMNGLNLSLMLAGKTGAMIQMVHVIGKSDDSNIDQIEKEYQIANFKFEEILHRQNEKSIAKNGLSYKILEGRIFESVTNLAEKTDDSLIVLSTHGRSGFEELFIGGNAYKIISHSHTPLITIRGGKVPAVIKKIVLPLDITFQTREKVPYTLQMAKLYQSEIHVLSVRLSNLKSIERKLKTYVDQVADFVKNQGIPCTVDSLSGSNLTDITLDYSRTVEADLISIMTEQEKSVSNLLLGSFAHQMINKADIPVLLFPNYQIQITSEDIWDLGAFNARN